MWAVSSEFSCDHASPGQARQFCADELATILPDRPETEDIISDAVLITSELVTNAVRAGCVQLQLHVSLDETTLQIAVHDDAAGVPTQRDAARDEPHGRGLAITAQIAERWGYNPTRTGKNVWAHMPLHGLLDASGR
jgi:anti-sigma regulatory factor (Ser/Thr protein kinase)